MDQEKVVLLTGIIVAFALGIFVLWGPSNIKPKRRRGLVGGLVNLGHSCFLNTLLQAFGSCPHLLHWLTRNEQSNGLIAALRLSLQVVNGEHKDVRDDPFAPMDVLAWLKARYHISPGEQDAHELFVIFITAMEDETALPQRTCSLADALLLPSRSEPLLNYQTNGEVKLRVTHSETLSLGRRILRQAASATAAENASPFQGLLTSSLQCISCKHKNVVQCTKVDSLSLALPPSNITASVTLTQLLDRFIAVETVSVRCDGCKQDSPATKTLNFAKLPGCLCIHIVRTTWTAEGEALKRTDHVDFPQLLVMDAYTYAQREGETRKHIYELRAVVVHSGDLNSGHFVTYRKSKHGWVLASDADVSASTWRQVQQASAYMLFYDKNM